LLSKTFMNKRTLSPMGHIILRSELFFITKLEHAFEYTIIRV